MSTVPSDATGDVIQSKIVLDASNALAAIAELQAKGQGLEATIKELAQAIRATAAEAGVDIDIVKEKYAELIAEMEAGGDIFGSFGAKAGMKEVGNELKDIAAAEEDAAAGGQALFTSANLLRTVFGTLVAMGVFQVIQAITVAFQDATKYATDYWRALQNITVAQNAMALGGVQTTNQQLIGMADELSKKFETFAKVDMLSAVSQAALLTQQLHLSVDQIQQLVEMAATLARLHGGMPADYIDNLIKAASGTNALWANQMGIAATADDLMAKAKQLGLVASDFTGKLTDQQKAIAGLSLEWDKLGSEEGKVLQDNNTALATADKATAAWKDSMTAVGTAITPIVNELKTIGAAILTFLVNYMETAQRVSFAFWSGVTAGAIAYNEVLKGNITSLQQLVQVLQQAYNLTYTQMQSALGPFNTGGLNLSNTPVSGAPDLTAGGTAAVAKPSDLNTVQQAYMSYYDQMNKDAQSFNNRMQDLQDQYNLNVKKETSDTNLRIQQIEQDSNLRREEQERAFQNKMKDLQGQYLLELEGALRKRDAEAVIMLIEKYKLQQDEAKRQQQLQSQQEAAQEKLRIEQVKADEQNRLAQMKAAYDLQKAQEERNYAQQKADLAHSLDEKLQEQAVKLGNEYNLNHDGIVKLYGLFSEYYGSDGKFASVQQDSYVQMETNTAGFIAQMQIYINQYAQVLSAVSALSPQLQSVNAPASGGGIRPFAGPSIIPFPTTTPPSTAKKARGGVDLAQSATTVTYGEAGPELAMFLPLNASQAGAIANSGIGGGGGAANGRVQIDITVASDLEARIVNSALTQAAISINKVTRSR